MLGAAVGFLFINQLWQSGENDYHNLMEMNQRMDKYAGELRRIQKQTEIVKQGMSNMFRTLDENPQELLKLKEQMQEIVNLSRNGLVAFEELGESFITMINRLEISSKADKKRHDEMVKEIKSRIAYEPPPIPTPIATKDL
jgi:DNA repair ATPase RecN